MPGGLALTAMTTDGEECKGLAGLASTAMTTDGERCKGSDGVALTATRRVARSRPTECCGGSSPPGVSSPKALRRRVRAAMRFHPALLRAPLLTNLGTASVVTIRVLCCRNPKIFRFKIM
eukprot:4963480-Prymnesium_polylepis.2